MVDPGLVNSDIFTEFGASRLEVPLESIARMSWSSTTARHIVNGASEKMEEIGFCESLVLILND